MGYSTRQHGSYVIRYVHAVFSKDSVLYTHPLLDKLRFDQGVP